MFDDYYGSLRKRDLEMTLCEECQDTADAHLAAERETEPSALPEMPLLPITSPETVKACQSLTVTERDIFVCSYPKSGTTWTQNLVVRLLAAQVGMELPTDWHLSHSAPFYEVDQYWTKSSNGDNSNSAATTTLKRVPAKTPIQSSDGTAYRVFNTHLRPHQLPPNAKYVYVMRDPMDVLVSFYHHLSNQTEADGGYSGTAKEFCQDFLNGTVLYGKWEDHLEAWLGRYYQKSNATKEDKNIMLLHYEEMKQDLKQEATRLAKFLDVPDEELESIVNTALSHCTFDAMKTERWRYTPQSVSWKVDPKTGKPYDRFVREGRIGDGKEFMEKIFTSDLKEQWIKNADRARRRWRDAGIDMEVDRYLGRRRS